MSKPVLGAILAVVAIGAIFGAIKLTPQGEVSAAPNIASDPKVAYLIDKAKSCQGEFAKLSPDDQRDVIARCGNNQNYASMSMKNYYNANK